MRRSISKYIYGFDVKNVAVWQFQYRNVPNVRMGTITTEYNQKHMKNNFKRSLVAICAGATLVNKTVFNCSLFREFTS